MLLKVLKEVTTSVGIQVVVIQPQQYGAIPLVPLKGGIIVTLSQVRRVHANGEADVKCYHISNHQLLL